MMTGHELDDEQTARAMIYVAISAASVFFALALFGVAVLTGWV
jgi:hypothetical protein